MEYLLVLLAIVSIFMAVFRPQLAKFKDQMAKGLMAGFFEDDPTGANFYYFPIR